jgi:hypothetical protein
MNAKKGITKVKNEIMNLNTQFHNLVTDSDFMSSFGISDNDQNKLWAHQMKVSEAKEILKHIKKNN